jgi:hypothetical protein
MTDLLKPQRTVEPRPADGETARYIRSYLIMRVLVGLLAVALPFLLVLLDGLVFDGEPFPRGSLSAYYYSGVREVFVGTLSATAVFLITYKVADRTLDNTLSTFAGLAVLVVALFPTGRPAHRGIALTPLQERLGESVVQWIHFTAAAAFIVSLAVISYFFGVREGARPAREGTRSPEFWRNYHWGCAAVIGLALLWIVVTELAGWPPKSLLVGEAVSVWAFGASWLMKGLELDILLGTRSPPISAES